MGFVTLADVKLFIGITGNAQDFLLNTFIAGTEAKIKNYCETDFTDKTVTNEILDGARGDTITPKYAPLISVQKVIMGCEVNGSGGFELDATKDYYFTENAIKMRYHHSMLMRGSISLWYHWGYSAVPDDIKLAVYQTVKAEYQRHGRKTEDMSSRAKEGESEGYNPSKLWDPATGLPVFVVAALQSYKPFEIPNAGHAQRNV